MRTISTLILLLLFISLLSHHILVLVVHGAEVDSAAATTKSTETEEEDATTTTTSDLTDPDVATKDSTDSSDRKSKDTVESSAFKDASTKSVTSTRTKTTSRQTTTSTTKDTVDETLDVINLNSRNFGQHLSDRNVVWLIEFYSPHCSHCVEFAAAYADIARHYHSGSSSSSSSSRSKHGTTQRTKRRIKVAKVNGEIERALVSRFSISAYPCFFVVDGFRVYKYGGLRLKKNLMAFVEGGYKTETAISFMESPMGPLGIFQGRLLSMGHLFLDIFQWAQNTFGLSPLIVGMILFGVMFMGCFFFIVSLALIIPEKPKRA